MSFGRPVGRPSFFIEEEVGRGEPLVIATAGGDNLPFASKGKTNAASPHLQGLAPARRLFGTLLLSAADTRKKIRYSIKLIPTPTEWGFAYVYFDIISS